MKILLGADVVPTAATEQYFVEGDAKTLFGKLTDISADADRVIVNLECALTNYDGAIKKFGPNIKAVPESVNGLLAFGITDAALSNNHVFDFGVQGLRDTMAALDGAGIAYTGIGENDTDSRKPHFFEKDGKRVGIVNVCEHEYTYALPNRIGANPFDPFLTMKDIRDAKAQCDYLVVLYHGGKEYCRYPSPRLYNLCHEMVHNGADVILTQHSHCIGCYEQYEGAHIVYGQGNLNFVFKNSYSCPECWFTALLVELDIDDTLKIKFHPVVATETGCDLAEGEKAEEIMSGFYERNASLLDGSWRTGWHEFCLSMHNNYFNAAMNASTDERSAQLFAHYLDCEAHSDVWRELFPTWNATNEL